MTAVPIIDEALCIGCGACVAACPNDVLSISSEDEKAKITNPLGCSKIGDCGRVCPTDAITLSWKISI